MERKTSTPEEIAEQQEYAKQVVMEELETHPEIKTQDEKINFVRTTWVLSDEEQNSILHITEENKEINPLLLDQTFALASFLKRKIIPDELAKMIRTRAKAWDYKTALEAMSQGETERVLVECHKVFDWNHTG